MRVCPIASGSSGNCIYVGDSTTHILIDAGVSCKKMVEGLKGIGIEPEDLSAIFITHEHSDHISGLRVFLKKYRIPTYATGKTVQAILRKDNTNEMEMDWFKIVKPDEKLQMQSMRFKLSVHLMMRWSQWDILWKQMEKNSVWLPILELLMNILYQIW